MASITSLPPELLTLILEELNHGRDLGNFFSAVKGCDYRVLPRDCRNEKDRQLRFLGACKRGFAEYGRLLLDAGASADETLPASIDYSQRRNGFCVWKVPSNMKVHLMRRFDWLYEPDGVDLPYIHDRHNAARVTPLALAIEGGHVEILRLLHDRKVDFDRNLLLHAHAYYEWTPEYGNKSLSMDYLSPFYLVKHRSVYEFFREIGLTPRLHFSVHQDKVRRDPVRIPCDLLSWMILRDAEPSAIALAIEDGACSIVAQVSEVPPLILACERGQVETARLLVQAGQSMKASTSWIASKRQPMSLEHLDHELVFKTETEMGYNSAIWYAFSSLKYVRWYPGSTDKLLQLVDMFIAAGLDLNNDALWSDSQIPLLHFAMLPHVDAKVARKLIANGSEVYRKTSTTFWAYIASVYRDSPRFVRDPAFANLYPDMLNASHVLEEQSRFLKWHNISPFDQSLSIDVAINLRSKTRMLLQNMIKHTTTPITDTLRPYLSIYNTLCLAELDSVLDLKQSNHKEELTTFQTRIAVLKQDNEGVVPISTSTFHNLRLWIEIFTHHQIDFVAPGFTAIEMVSSMIVPSDDDWRAKAWGYQFATASARATPAELADVVWHNADVEDSVLEAWQMFLTSTPSKPQQSYFKEWCTFRDQESLIERMRDNLQWILKTCFKLDIENGRGIRPDKSSPIEMLLGHVLVNMRADVEQELDVLYGNYRTKALLENVELLTELPGWECEI